MSSIGGTYGLSGSGMDIDSIVKSLMTTQQAKADALLQKKTVTEWQKAAYNAVYDDINAFRTSVFNFKLQSTLSPNKVSSSNASVATVTAISDAADVNHSLVVTQLAGGVNLTSSATITAVAAPDKLNIGNQMYGGAAPIGLYKFTISNGEESKEITIDPAKSINDLVSQINSAGVNVKASYDSTLDRFFMSTTNTGSFAEIKIVNDVANDVSWGADFFVDKLKLPIEVSTTGKTGKAAEFTLDDVALTQANNSFSISGLTYNLTGVSATPVNISVTNDTDKALASIQSLVDSYNKILADINGKMNETRYKDFPPLTDAQKSVMKETDITAWETKAKSGMLHNDSTLASLVNSMRSAFSNPVTGSTPPYNSGASIGITTGSYTEGGKLYLNTDKLRTALQANPDVLNQMFGATGTDFNTQGIAGRLYDGIKTKMDQVAQIAGTTGGAQYDTQSNFAKKISAYDLQINHQADRFSVVEAAYYRKFNAMELALQQMNSQSSWLQSFGTTS
ncbi:MAG TPA: flagellar filament capping protein FliD [Desulfosporosinus sp.]|nr:flagellar filament capping protein FliD [Desulfosporosinus sp.]